MNNMKKLSLLLLALSGAGLTACNSGSSSATQAPKQNTVASIESITEQKINASEGIAESTPSIKADEHATIGYVITKDGNLDFYKNDKFIGVVHKFEDKGNKVQIAEVGDGYNLNIVYVSTYAHPRTLPEQGVIHKCFISANGNSASCSEIYRIEDGASIENFAFDGNGNGYVQTHKGLVRFKGDRVYGVRNDIINFVSLNGNNHFFTRKSYNENTGISTFLEYAGFDDYQPKEHQISSGKYYFYNYMSIDNVNSIDGIKGYALCFMPGEKQNDHSFCSIYKGHASRMHGFEDTPTGISSIVTRINNYNYNYIYVSTATYPSPYQKESGKGELKKCDPSGYCSTIDTFKSGAMDSAFATY